ncbi:MAG: hypothetical protein P4L76_11755 [Beijerinckiaceae bacterium]|nr:hypothetical protein [Beijerinckiaceae bacterium]
MGVVDLRGEPETINFGDLPEAADALLQQGVVAYRTDRRRAGEIFREALEAHPHLLPIYFCLYKIHFYQGNLEEARLAAEAGLAEATRQAGWSSEWPAWRPQPFVAGGPAHFALYTLKALAFIHLRLNELGTADAMLDALRLLDPAGTVGWPVIAALAEGISA